VAAEGQNADRAALGQADTTPHSSDVIWIDVLKTPAMCQRLGAGHRRRQQDR
jgi:hypothetical protein